MLVYLKKKKKNYLLNLRWTGFTRPQPIVGRVYPSNLAIYPSKGRVDGSLDETVAIVYLLLDSFQTTHPGPSQWDRVVSMDQRYIGEQSNFIMVGMSNLRKMVT